MSSQRNDPRPLESFAQALREAARALKRRPFVLFAMALAMLCAELPRALSLVDASASSEAEVAEEGLRRSIGEGIVLMGQDGLDLSEAAAAPFDPAATTAAFLIAILLFGITFVLRALVVPGYLRAQAVALEGSRPFGKLLLPSPKVTGRLVGYQIVTWLIYGGVLVVGAIPGLLLFLLGASTDRGGAGALGIILLTALPLFGLAFAYAGLAFGERFIVLGGLGPVSALHQSWGLLREQRLWLTGFVLSMVLVEATGWVGGFFFGVGLLLTLPLAHALAHLALTRVYLTRSTCPLVLEATGQKPEDAPAHDVRAHLVRDERGLSFVEYLIILCVVALLGFGGWKLFGTSVSDEVVQASGKVALVHGTTSANAATGGAGGGSDGSGGGSPVGGTSGALRATSGSGPGSTPGASGGGGGGQPSSGTHVATLPAQPTAPPMGNAAGDGTSSAGAQERSAEDFVAGYGLGLGNQVVALANEFNEAFLYGPARTVAGCNEVGWSTCYDNTVDSTSRAIESTVEFFQNEPVDRTLAAASGWLDRSWQATKEHWNECTSGSLRACGEPLGEGTTNGLVAVGGGVPFAGAHGAGAAGAFSTKAITRGTERRAARRGAGAAATEAAAAATEARAVGGSVLNRYFSPEELRAAHPDPGHEIYHNLDHTRDVAGTETALSRARGLSDSEVEFNAQVAAIHDWDPSRTPGVPARAAVTIEDMRADFDGERPLIAGYGGSILRDRFGWDERELAMGQAMVQRTEFPFDAAHPAYPGTTPRAVYEGMLSDMNPADRAYVLREGPILSEYADKGGAKMLDSFDEMGVSTDGLANEVRAVNPNGFIPSRSGNEGFMATIGQVDRSPDGSINPNGFDAFASDREIAAHFGESLDYPDRAQVFDTLGPAYRDNFEGNLVGSRAYSQSVKDGADADAAQQAGRDAAARVLRESASDE